MVFRAASVTTLVLAVSAAACFTTQVHTGAPAVGPTHSDRQWFTIGGLVGFSDPAGHECGSAGLSRSESRMAGMDVVINIGLALVGGAVGAGICDSEASPETYASCVTTTANLVPFLLSSRTVSYQCAGGGGVAELEPVPGGQQADQP